jgi:hypothetical protein
VVWIIRKNVSCDQDEESIDHLMICAFAKGLNSLVILGAWTLWKHRIRCVFDGAAPIMVVALTQAEEEPKVWELAGAKRITYLTAQLPVG